MSFFCRAEEGNEENGGYNTYIRLEIKLYPVRIHRKYVDITYKRRFVVSK